MPYDSEATARGFATLRSRLLEAQSFMARLEWTAARRALAEVRRDATRMLIDSPFLDWMEAIAADHEGDHRAAAKHIEAACSADPLCLTFVRSRQIIFDRVRSVFMEACRGDADPTVVPLFDVLLAHGEAHV